MPEEDGYEAILRFPNESTDFSNGFTCGIIWQMLKTSDDNFTQLVKSELKPIIKSMCAASGWELSMEQIDDEWMFVSFTR